MSGADSAGEWLAEGTNLSSLKHALSFGSEQDP